MKRNKKKDRIILNISGKEGKKTKDPFEMKKDEMFI